MPYEEDLDKVESILLTTLKNTPKVCQSRSTRQQHIRSVNIATRRLRILQSCHINAEISSQRIKGRVGYFVTVDSWTNSAELSWGQILRTSAPMPIRR